MAMLKQFLQPLSSYQYNIVKVLSPIKIRSNVSDPMEFLDSNISNTVDSLITKNKFTRAVIHYQYTGNDSTLYKSLNLQLNRSCSSIPEKLIGMASLTTDNIELSVSQIEEYSDSQHIRGFSLDCRSIATTRENYKEAYYLLEMCNKLGMPILFSCDDSSNSFENTSVISQALCQIISDGILDYYPHLKIIIQAENGIPQIIQELDNVDPGKSLQKHRIDYYLNKNIFCVSTCSDEHYVQYLISKLSDSQVLFGGADTDSVPAITSLSQLSHQKLMGQNSEFLFSLNSNDHKLWNVNMGKVSVINQMRCIKLLSSKLRDESTDYKDFMLYGDRLMNILAEEALARVPAVIEKDIVTPTGIFRGLEDRSDKQLCVVSIIRSGDILLEAVRKLVPGIRVGKILIQRDEDSEDKHAVLYYQKLPKDIADCYVLLVDPMLATGGSLICAVDVLKDKGVSEKNIMFVNLFCVEEGIENVQEKFPEMEIVTLAIDDYMNSDKYIVPGVGDFGDRYYGTNH